MAIWEMELVGFGQGPQATASLTIEDRGNGHASGTLRNLRGPATATELDLSGVVVNDTFVVSGSNAQVGINLALYFAPFVFAFTGGARLALHQANRVLDLYVVTRASE